MIPVFAHPEIATRLQDHVRRAMEAEVQRGRLVANASAVPTEPAVPRRRKMSPTSRTAVLLRVFQDAPDQLFTSRDLAEILACNPSDLSWYLAHLVSRGCIRRIFGDALGASQYQLIADAQIEVAA